MLELEHETHTSPSSAHQEVVSDEDTMCASPGYHTPDSSSEIKIYIQTSRYAVVGHAVAALGWKQCRTLSDADMVWNDTPGNRRVQSSGSKPQCSNHLPGMAELTRKKGLARNLARLAQVMPERYDFMPRTLLLPEQLPALLAALDENERPGRSAPLSTFILKPDAGSQGRGILLAQRRADLEAWCPEGGGVPAGVASRYIERPLLLGDSKFDLRLYVLVLGTAPLDVSIFTEGLVRRCTQTYAPPTPRSLGQDTAHLTNWAVNRARALAGSGAAGGGAFKWTLRTLRDWMSSRGLDWGALWGRVRDLVALSLLAVAPGLACAARPRPGAAPAYELLGYDVLVDARLKPWLLEVNASPSLCLDTAADAEVKRPLVAAALAAAARAAGLLGVEGEDAGRRGSAAGETTRLRDPRQEHAGQDGGPRFERILPTPDDGGSAGYGAVLAASAASFLSGTAQGRLERSLAGMQARRQAAEREREARASAQARKVAALKAWIARECARQREARVPGGGDGGDHRSGGGEWAAAAEPGLSCSSGGEPSAEGEPCASHRSPALAELEVPLMDHAPDDGDAGPALAATYGLQPPDSTRAGSTSVVSEPSSGEEGGIGFSHPGITPQEDEKAENTAGPGIAALADEAPGSPAAWPLSPRRAAEELVPPAQAPVSATPGVLQTPAGSQLHSCSAECSAACLQEGEARPELSLVSSVDSLVSPEASMCSRESGAAQGTGRLRGKRQATPAPLSPGGVCWVRVPRLCAQADCGIAREPMLEVPAPPPALEAPSAFQKQLKVSALHAPLSLTGSAVSFEARPQRFQLLNMWHQQRV
uniref:Tubulin polyglutamylase TTLL2 n=1 Tax=Auxenochlorella protothecoides TaxID=3075 RepID=A0A1D2ACC3_AUXPR